MSLHDRRQIEAAIAARSIVNPIRWLVRIGIVRPHHSKPGGLRWPLSAGPWHCWRYTWRYERAGLFRNRRDVVRDVGTWLPRRWGFYVLGIEFGQRG